MDATKDRGAQDWQPLDPADIAIPFKWSLQLYVCHTSRALPPTVRILSDQFSGSVSLTDLNSGENSWIVLLFHITFDLATKGYPPNL